MRVNEADQGILNRLCPQHTFLIAGKQLELEQRLRESVGAVVWEAALVLSRFLEECSQPQGVYPDAVRLKGKRVLELGTGTGLVGMVAHLLGAQQVVLTDREEILSVTRDNVRHNMPHAVSPSDTDHPSSSPIMIKPLLWGSGEESCLGGAFDFVFAADLLYNNEHHEALLQTLLAVCADTSTTVIMVQKWRDSSKESGFFMQAEMHGLRYEMLELHTGLDGLGIWRWSGFPNDEEGIQIFRMRRI